LLGSTLIMSKYGYVKNIIDTPKNNIWMAERNIELKDNSIVYGCEGDFDIEKGKGKMFTKHDFLIWLEENRKLNHLAKN